MRNRRIELKYLGEAKTVLRIIPEGRKLSDKIILFLSIFYSLYCFSLNKILRGKSMRLCYYLLRDCIIRNYHGLWLCRSKTNDPLIVGLRHEFDLREYFESIKTGVFIDVGAHIGKYTVQVARQLQDRGRVISIEAHPGNFSTLVKNIKLNNLANVIAVNKAAWSENRSLGIYTDSESTTTAAYSVVEEFQGDHVMVDAKRLDDIAKELRIDAASFMKLDVEGAEPQVLEGAEELLKRSDNLKIIFECSRETAKQKCKEILGKYGYAVKHVGLSYYLAEHG